MVQNTSSDGLNIAFAPFQQLATRRMAITAVGAELLDARSASCKPSPSQLSLQGAVLATNLVFRRLLLHAQNAAPRPNGLHDQKKMRQISESHMPVQVCNHSICSFLATLRSANLLATLWGKAVRETCLLQLVRSEDLRSLITSLVSLQNSPKEECI